MGLLDDLELFFSMLAPEEQAALRSTAKKLGRAVYGVARARMKARPTERRSRRPPPPPPATAEAKADARLLGVRLDATADQVKKAYKRLALKHHPDRPGGDGAKFAAIASAYRRALARAELRRF